MKTITTGNKWIFWKTQQSPPKDKKSVKLKILKDFFLESITYSVKYHSHHIDNP